MTKIREPGSPRAALDRLFREVGGYTAAADFLGRNPHHLRHCTDPDDDRDIGFRQVVMLTRAFGATAAAEHIAAQAGGVFMPCPVSNQSFEALMGHSAKEFGEAVSQVMQASADGNHDLREMLQTRAEMLDVLRVFGCAVATLNAKIAAAGGE
jgi:hypothetical protein